MSGGDAELAKCRKVEAGDEGDVARVVIQPKLDELTGDWSCVGG